MAKKRKGLITYEDFDNAVQSAYELGLVDQLSLDDLRKIPSAQKKIIVRMRRHLKLILITNKRLFKLLGEDHSCKGCDRINLLKKQLKNR